MTDYPQVLIAIEIHKVSGIQIMSLVADAPELENIRGILIFTQNSLS